MLGTQGLHQGGHLVKVVSGHGGEEAAETRQEGDSPDHFPSCQGGDRGQAWIGPAPWYSLVLDLEIEVPTEPVVEEGLLHIAGGHQLQGGSGW